MRLNVFEALRPTAGHAQAVASVPYDTVDTEEARALAEGNALSFLRVVRPEINFPAGKDMYADDVYACAADKLRGLVAQGILNRDSKPSVYVYELRTATRSQCGVMGCCHADDYASNVIRKHEKTREDKERDRARHVKTVRAHTGPVFLTYRGTERLNALMELTRRGPALLETRSPDGVVHRIWKVADPAEVISAFEAVPMCYIADGHHRAAAAAAVAAELRAANPGHTGAEEYNWFMGVLFPADQLRILPYYRVVRDLNGLSPAGFLDKLRAAFGSVRADAPAEPVAGGQLSVYLDGRWYGIAWDRSALPADPVARLDVSVVQEKILAPMLGVADPRRDTRIGFVGGIRGPGELTRLVDSGQAAVAFSLYPVTVDDMMEISDHGCIMPPKSTWFEPKLRSGLLIHTF